MNFLSKVRNFFISFAKHTYKGMPKASKELIDKRYALCVVCSEFDKENSECGVCGCSISKKQEFFNKLAWEDQRCPLEKW